jgi:hypothetical protein
MITKEIDELSIVIRLIKRDIPKTKDLVEARKLRVKLIRLVSKRRLLTKAIRTN